MGRSIRTTKFAFLEQNLTKKIKRQKSMMRGMLYTKDEQITNVKRAQDA